MNEEKYEKLSQLFVSMSELGVTGVIADDNLCRELNNFADTKNGRITSRVMYFCGVKINYDSGNTIFTTDIWGS